MWLSAMGKESGKALIILNPWSFVEIFSDYGW